MTEITEKMQTKWDEAIAGMGLCLLGLLAIGYLIWQMNETKGDPDTGYYHLSAFFYDCGGIQPGNAIHVSGVQVGIVEKVALIPELAQARVDMMVEADYSFPEDSEVRIESAGLFAGQVVIITPGTSERHMVDQQKFVNVINSQSLEAEIGGALLGAGLE